VVTISSLSVVAGFLQATQILTSRDTALAPIPYFGRKKIYGNQWQQELTQTKK
jgi:hypothetical protein